MFKAEAVASGEKYKFEHEDGWSYFGINTQADSGNVVSGRLALVITNVSYGAIF